MGNWFGIIVNVVYVLFAVVILVGIILRLMQNYVFKVVEVPATVIEKQSYTKSVLSKAQAPTDKQVYVVTFLAKDKKRAFQVSALTFDRYTVNQKGILKYQGTRLLDFKDE